MEAFLTPDFWIAVGQIILIDILLGGDNAVVIGLACRRLEPRQRMLGIFWGTAGAIGLRVVLIFFALTLLAVPYLKLFGAALLLWIGVKLLLPEDEEAHSGIEASTRLWTAIKTIIVADFVMSLDNVIAIAGAAEGAGGEHKLPLVVFGLLVSIPIIVWGSQLVIKLMDRFPVIITLGGMLLGWIAGTMAISDPALAGVLPASPATPPRSVAELAPAWRYGAGVAGALLVLALGRAIAARRRRAEVRSKHAVVGMPTGRESAEEQRPAEEALPVGAGSLLGRWRLERELAGGARASTWLASDSAGGARAVIKIFARSVPEAEDEPPTPLLGEVETARRLDHPDIARILDSGQARDFAWIAYEHAPGQSLAHGIAAGRRFDAAVAVAVAARVARALAHAHAGGVVHGDIRPANLIVDVEAGSVKVVDFGIARRERTQTATQAYIAPEQLGGGRVDGATDLYALGVVLFELLTGRLPYAADSPGALLAAIANEPATSLLEPRPDLPPELAASIARALAKDRRQRHADGNALADELDAIAARLRRPAGAAAGQAGQNQLRP